MLDFIIKWFITVLSMVFVLGILWRFFMGTKQQGGYFRAWRSSDEAHQAEQTELGVESRHNAKVAQTAAYDNATTLHVLTTSQEPPDGAAWIAQEQVAEVARTVTEIKKTVDEIERILKTTV